MTQTLEQQLVALCERAALRSIEIKVRPDGTVTASVFADFGHALVMGASGYDSPSAADAIKEALSALNAKRAPVILAPVEGLAA